MKQIFVLFAITFKVAHTFHYPNNFLHKSKAFLRNNIQNSFCSGFASKDEWKRIQSYTNVYAEERENRKEEKDINDLNQQNSLLFYQRLIEEFQGDFDNFYQVQENEKSNLYPGEGGGHDHIHATLLPLSEQTCARMMDKRDELFYPSMENEDPPYEGRNDQTNITPHFILACYYIGGAPSKIFRFRLYSFEPTLIGTNMKKTNSKSNNLYDDNMNVLLKIYTVDPDFISLIKKDAVDQPTQWEHQFWNFLLQQKTMDSKDKNITGECKSYVFELLEGCNVLWTPTIDPKRHSYIFDDPKISFNKDDYNQNSIIDNSFHAIMLNETGAIVNSTIIPGKKIRIQDELSLWFGESSESSSIPTAALWINDRGFDLENGDFIYGNRVGVPYKMDRVSSFQPNADFDVDNHSTLLPRTRVIVQKGLGKKLRWTLEETVFSYF